MTGDNHVVTFVCEGCGTIVHLFGRRTVPDDGFCGMCAFLCEHVPDPDEFWALYQRQKDFERAPRAGET